MNTFFNIFIIKIRFSFSNVFIRGESNFDDKYVEKSVQPVRGSSFRNDLLQNPYFKVNDDLIEKIDKLMKEVEKYKSSNQEDSGDVNSKLDKVLNVLNENADESPPTFQIFDERRGNVMTCYWESFFDMENFMTSYGITGKNVTSHILSYLDFKSMMAARMVSKTWYNFIENEQGLWINLMRKCFEDIPKKTLSPRVENRGTNTYSNSNVRF